MTRGRLAGCVACATVIALATFACRQIVGIQGDPPTGPLTGVCGMPYVGACGSCVAASCCDQAAACAADPSCAPYATCLARCNGDPRCRAQCAYDNNPPGTPATSPALSTCVAAHCEEACGLTCGGVVDSFSVPDAAAACEACAATNICTSEQACAVSEECTAYGLCFLSCQGRGDCETTCATGRDAGAALFDPIVTAADGTCGSACGVGNYWGCIGHVTWPAPKAAVCTLQLYLYDGFSSQPVPGVQAALCSPAIDSCAPAVAQTNALGQAAVTVALPSLEQNTLGPTGFLRLTGVDDAGAPTTVPELFSWTFPLSQPAFGLPVFVLTPAELSSFEITAGVNQDPSRGLLAAVAQDCLDQDAPAMQVAVSPSDALTQRVYLQDGTPSLTATQTDRSGVADFANVIAGTVQVTTTSVSTGQIVSRTSVLVQPGTITVVYMVPTP